MKKNLKIIIVSEPGCGKTTIAKIILDALKERNLEEISYTDIDLNAEELSKITKEQWENNIKSLRGKINIQIEQQQAMRGEMTIKESYVKE